MICRVAYSSTEMKVFNEVNAKANILNGGSFRQEALATVLYVPWRYINEVQEVPGENS